MVWGTTEMSLCCGRRGVGSAVGNGVGALGRRIVVGFRFSGKRGSDTHGLIPIALGGFNTGPTKGKGLEPPVEICFVIFHTAPLRRRL